MEIFRTLTVTKSPDEVFRYLQDFTTTEEWDPATIRTTRVYGDGGVGTRYDNVSKFLGRETQLTYVVEQVERPRRLRLRGENDTVLAHDTITLTPTTTGGTELTYRAEFDLKGVARLAAPLLAPAFKRLGDRSERALRAALG